MTQIERFLQQLNRFTEKQLLSESICLLEKNFLERHLSLWSSNLPRDLKHIQSVLSFVNSLHVYTPQGPQKIQLLPWQIITLVDLFGFRTGDKGSRLFKRCFISIPRKNGKTTFSAIVTLLGLLHAPPGATLILAATSRDQARITKEYLEFIIGQTPDLDTHFKVLRKEIRNIKTGAKLIVLPGDVTFSWGYNAYLVVVDELHAFKKPGLWDSLIGSTIANPDSLVIGISTAGQDITGVYSRLRNYSELVLSKQVQDETWYTFITTKNPEVSWQDDLAIRQANPGVDHIVPFAELNLLRKQALVDSSQELAFRRYHLNEIVSDGSTFISLDQWRKQEVKEFDFEDVDLISFGVDLATTHDLAAVVVTYFDKQRTIIFVEGKAWTSARLLLESPIASQLASCRDKGELIVCEGERIDFSSIANFIASKWIPGKSVIYIDPYQSQALIHELEKQIQLSGIDVIEVNQSANVMDMYIRKTQILASQERLKHDFNRLFEICLSNTAIKENKKGKLHFVKLREKIPIDLSVALTLSLIPANENPTLSNSPLVEVWS